jgi:hypothetical protein
LLSTAEYCGGQLIVILRNSLNEEIASTVIEEVSCGSRVGFFMKTEYRLGIVVGCIRSFGPNTIAVPCRVGVRLLYIRATRVFTSSMGASSFGDWRNDR